MLEKKKRQKKTKKVSVSEKQIVFTNNEVSFRILRKQEIRNLMLKILKKEDKRLGHIDVILCSDMYLYEMNMKYLKHKFYTDVITFDYSDEHFDDKRKKISGDIFISIDRIKENKTIFKVKIQEELTRVIIHGLLHLCGYNDKTKIQKNEMRRQESHYLGLIKM